MIELGLDRDPPRLDLPRPVPVHRRRAGASALVIAAALGLTAGSVPAGAPPAGVRIAAGPGDRVVLAADRLYLYPSDTRWIAGSRGISAYRLPDGHPLWREPLPVEGQVRQVMPAPGTLLVVVEQHSRLDTVAIDAGSGQVRWRREVQPAGVTAMGRLLVGVVPAEGGDPSAERIAALDLATGRNVWAYDVPADAWHGMAWPAYWWMGSGHGDTRPRSVTAWPSGRVAVRDLSTGRVVTTGDLGDVPRGSHWFQLAGDFLLAVAIVDGMDVVTAYRLPGLDRRWTVTLDLFGGYVSADCGALCFFRRTGGMWLVDPRTGAIRWSDPRWQGIQTAGGQLLAHAWPSTHWHATTALLDPLTGDELLDLGRWTILEPAAGDSHIRAVRLDPASARAWFAVVDLRAPAVRVVFSAGGVSGGCQAGDGVVVCRRTDASVGVWRFS